MPSLVLFKPFRDDLQKVVATAWPDCREVIQGGFESRFSWIDFRLPYAVIFMQRWPLSQDYGKSNLVFIPRVRMYYINQTDGLSDLIELKLTSLVGQLWPQNPLTTGQFKALTDGEDGGICYADELPPNELFISGLRHQRAGRVEADFIVGITRGTS